MLHLHEGGKEGEREGGREREVCVCVCVCVVLFTGGVCPIDPLPPDHRYYTYEV